MTSNDNINNSGTDQSPPASSPAAIADMLETVELPELELPAAAAAADAIRDAFRGNVQAALRLGIIGSGQAGGRMAHAAWQVGYRRVVVMNTTSQDLDPLDLPAERKLLLATGGGGAGKDPAVGGAAVRAHRHEIRDLLEGRLGTMLDWLLLAFGAGGGSGTGSAVPMIDEVLPGYLDEVQRRTGHCPGVGVLTSFPRRAEGPRVARNAHAVLTWLFSAAKEGKVSPLIVVDLEKIDALYPGLPIHNYWDKVNAQVIKLLHVFNVLAGKPSPMVTFDRSEFIRLMGSGTVVYGVTQVTDYDSVTMTRTVRQSVETGLLAQGYDWSTATMAAVIGVADQEVLSRLPRETFDRVLSGMLRSVGSPGQDFVLHQGLYPGPYPDLRIFTMLGGLAAPSARMRELEAATGREKNHDE